MPNISYFLGANSPQGFYSLMDRLLDPAKARAIYILKGGAGCGKSSFMKRVGKRAEEAGLVPHSIRCSADPDSLDGLLLPELQVALVDGTAPHVVEPVYPGVVERYVNLGRFYDSAGLQPYRGEILELNGAYKGCYRRAYRCLKGAGQLLEDNRELLETKELQTKLHKRARGIIAREIPKNGPGGQVTERFLDAVSCRGWTTLFETVDSQCRKVFELCDSYGLAHLLLEELLAAAVERGWGAVACADPMAPQRLRHLLLPEAGVAFVTGTPENPYPGKPYRRVRLDAMTDEGLLRRNRARVRFSRKVSKVLLDEGVEALAQGKALHDDLEKVYNPHVDFQGVYAQAEAVADEILAQRPD